MLNQWRGGVPRHSRTWALVFFLYWLAMFLATHLPMPKVESAPKNTDKLVHFVMYAGFVFWLAFWQSANKPWNRTLCFWIFFAAVVYAGLDEILQIPLESRSADVWDFAMDLIGAVLGLLLFWGLRAKCDFLWDAAKTSE